MADTLSDDQTENTMNQTLSLSQWLTASRPVTTPVAWQEYAWTLGHLRHDVALLIDHLRDQPGNRWALCLKTAIFYCSVVGHATLR